MAFQVPQKAILSPDQLQAFQTSATRQQVVSYIESLNEAVVGVKLSDECPESPVYFTALTSIAPSYPRL